LRIACSRGEIGQLGVNVCNQLARKYGPRQKPTSGS
jgi:hypothetical protein